LNIELKLSNKYLEIEKEISKLKINEIYEIKGSYRIESSEIDAIRKDSDTTFSYLYLEKVKGQNYYNILYTNLDITKVMEITSEIIPDLI
jgi:hypothetical protein